MPSNSPYLQDFNNLSPEARQRVEGAFRQGSSGLDEMAIRDRWNAMTPQQRNEAVMAGERAARATRGGSSMPRR
jgi:hypothetical protein